MMAKDEIASEASMTMTMRRMSLLATPLAPQQMTSTSEPGIHEVHRDSGKARSQASANRFDR
jgi:hypothetical protein